MGAGVLYAEASRYAATASRRSVIIGLSALAGTILGPAVRAASAAGGAPSGFDPRHGVSVTDFGAVADSDGTPGSGKDNLVAFEKAFASGARVIYIPSAPAGMAYRLAGPWRVSDSRYIQGDGAVAYDTIKPALGIRGTGSWLYFDHPGIGINVDAGARAVSGGIIQGIGTIRNQPAATRGWVPASNDFDLTLLGGDWYLDNICLWNPTNGINHNYAGLGRLRIGYICGDPFACGIRVDRCYDPFRIEGGVHFWPFAGIDPDHRAYKLANLVGLDMRHCDEALIDDFFVGGASRGVVMSGGGDGRPPRDIQFGKLTVDLCGYAGIVVGASTPEGGSFSVDDFVTQGAVAGDGNPSGAHAGVVIAAKNFVGKITNARYSRFNREMVSVTGANSTFYQGPATIDAWNQADVNAPAFAATGEGSRILLTAPPTILTRGGAVADGTGRVQQATYSPI